jgi:hypothetical protein
MSDNVIAHTINAHDSIVCQGKFVYFDYESGQMWLT